MIFLDLDFVIKRIVKQNEFRNKLEILEKEIDRINNEAIHKNKYERIEQLEIATTLNKLTIEYHYFSNLEKLYNMIENILIREKNQDEVMERLLSKINSLEQRITELE